MMLVEGIDLLIKAGTLGCTVYAVWKLNQHGKTLDTITHQTNDLTDKLVVAEKLVSHAAGIEEGLNRRP